MKMLGKYVYCNLKGLGYILDIDNRHNYIEVQYESGIVGYRYYLDSDKHYPSGDYGYDGKNFDYPLNILDRYTVNNKLVLPEQVSNDNTILDILNLYFKESKYSKEELNYIGLVIAESIVSSENKGKMFKDSYEYLRLNN